MTIEPLARFGYLAKGIVYLGVGGLTAAAALGNGSGNAQGSRDALGQIEQVWLGTTLLALVAVGIGGYVLWRLTQAFLDPEGRGTSLKGLGTRVVLFASALMYGGLGLWALRALRGVASSGGGGGAESWSATLLAQPYGRWLLGLFALAVIGYGIAEWTTAIRGSFQKRLKGDLDEHTRRWVSRVGRAGHASRGVVFFTIGGFLMHAAWTTDPSAARGLEGSLEALGSTGWGPWVMGVVALGLAAYGALQVVKARYRRIEVDR